MSTPDAEVLLSLRNLLVAPLGLGSALAMPLAGRLSDKLGARSLVQGGAALSAVSAVVLARLDAAARVERDAEVDRGRARMKQVERPDVYRPPGEIDPRRGGGLDDHKCA